MRNELPSHFVHIDHIFVIALLIGNIADILDHDEEKFEEDHRLMMDSNVQEESSSGMGFSTNDSPTKMECASSILLLLVFHLSDLVVFGPLQILIQSSPLAPIWRRAQIKWVSLMRTAISNDRVLVGRSDLHHLDIPLRCKHLLLNLTTLVMVSTRPTYHFEYCVSE